MSGNRVLFYNEALKGGVYRLRIRKARGDSREWWIYHPQTKSIRLFSSRGYAISNEHGQGLNRGRKLVMRQYRA